MLHLIHLENPVPLFNSHHHFVKYPRTGESRILISGMHIFLNSGGEDARSTQAKHVFIITSEREEVVIQLLWRNDRKVNQAAHSYHASISIHSSPS